MTELLQGKTIIVTGAAGGIGQATCAVLAAAGANVVMSDLGAAGAAAACQSIRDAGGEARFIAADLGSETDIESLVDQTVAAYGRLDGAFNNAGVEQCNKPLADLTLDEWSRAIRIDLTAVFLCLKYQVRAMLRSGGGAIVNTSSSLGLSHLFDRLRSRHSMNRFGEPHEIGEAVAWLLSDHASFVNGAAIAVDGGYLSI
jgi:NAD(P)-dependent dehydrogenase (short-subunit alcohol dehydrogenase family)